MKLRIGGHPLGTSLKILTVSAIASVIWQSYSAIANVRANGTLLTAFSATATINRPSLTKALQGFYCDTSSGLPVTMYQNDRGVTEPWIRWADPDFDPAYNIITHCQQVSDRLETYRRHKQLKFLTVGTINEQNAICAASQSDRCESLILTLKTREDAVKALNYLFVWRELNYLFVWREGLTVTPSLNNSNAIPYIDLRGRLGNNASNTLLMRPHNTQPSIRGGMRDR